MSRIAESIFVVAAFAGAEAYAGSHPEVAGKPDSYAVAQSRGDHAPANVLEGCNGPPSTGAGVILPALRPTIARSHQHSSTWTDHVFHAACLRR